MTLTGIQCFVTLSSFTITHFLNIKITLLISCTMRPQQTILFSPFFSLEHNHSLLCCYEMSEKYPSKPPGLEHLVLAGSSVLEPYGTFKMWDPHGGSESLGSSLEHAIPSPVLFPEKGEEVGPCSLHHRDAYCPV